VTRRNILLGTVLVLLVGLVAAIVVRSLSAPSANRIFVAGDVRAVVRTVSAPTIAYPNADYTVAVPSNAAAGASVITLARTTPRTSGGAARSGQPVVSGKLAAVSVHVGDHVEAGQVIARLDTTLLDLGVQQAKVNAANTRTKVKVLRNNLDTILDNQDKITDGKSQLATGREQLATAKGQLATGKAQLKTAKSGLLAARADTLALQRLTKSKLAAAKAKAATYPPGSVPGNILGEIQMNTMKLAGIKQGLAKISAGLAKVNAGFAKLATASAKIAAAEGKLATAADQLATASDALKTAKKQVVRARDSLKIIADSASIGIALAEVKRDQATISTPVSGVVTQAAAQGTVALVGAPIVRIRPDEPALVDTYLTAEQLGKLRAGAPADVTYDSGHGTALRGTLALVGDNALFPPTSFPTDIVHMTRTVKVTFRLDSGDGPPPGTPVDIAIHTD
jgi:multidrug efflux pump subunit AcrA (membrane-fusion protein)